MTATGADPLAAFRLDGRVAIVTGASSGFGAHFCRVLAAAGAQVVGVARRAERLDEVAGDVPGLLAIPADVTDDESCKMVIDTTKERLGRIDVLVNNAGTTDGPAVAHEEDPALFRRVVDINLTACFVLSGLAARVMIDQGGGSMVNISSVHGLVASAPNTQAAYTASKAGLINLSRELALQWARYGIRVNAIAPGYFGTELTEEMFDDQSSMRWIQRNTPLRRPGELAELDGVLLLLASEAGSYLTGQVIAVDGGWTAR